MQLCDLFAEYVALLVELWTGELHFRSDEADGGGLCRVGSIGFEGGVIEAGEQLIVVLHRERVIFVIVALGAFERGT